MNTRILLVDDDPNILSAFKRQLRKQFDLDFAEGGGAAIRRSTKNEPYAVVVSDMQMPDVDGLKFLCHVRDCSPETVRIMLTGNADQKTATDAVNEGHIFRFLNKPCASDDLAHVLKAGLEQYRLVTAEQELLSQTLNGSIDLLTDVLSMVNPTAFGRANRVRYAVKKMSQVLDFPNSWRLEIAAALSQIGCVTIPGELLEKSYAGEQMGADDQQMIDEHPHVAAKLVSQIPRLQDVGTIIELATSSDQAESGDHDKSIFEASKILDLVLSYDLLACIGSPSDALAQISLVERFCDHKDWINALSQAVAEGFDVTSVKICDLESGMILDEELRTESGVLLITKGQQLTQSLIARLANYVERGGVQETVSVRSAR